MYSREEKKVGQCFFANVSLLEILLFLWLLLKYLYSVIHERLPMKMSLYATQN
jgi:hypothetical protein